MSFMLCHIKLKYREHSNVNFMGSWDLSKFIGPLFNVRSQMRHGRLCNIKSTTLETKILIKLLKKHIVFCSLFFLGAQWRLKRHRQPKCSLTGAGPRSQRGLESPGAVVGRCSLKDEGDRQGDKHGPLSTWGSLFVAFFYSGLTFLLVSSVVASVDLWPALRALSGWLQEEEEEERGARAAGFTSPCRCLDVRRLRLPGMQAAIAAPA